MAGGRLCPPRVARAHADEARAQVHGLLDDVFQALDQKTPPTHGRRRAAGCDPGMRYDAGEEIGT
ncbi:MAG: hypothetical protein WKF47_12445 [Geodermatophilaceae bacterium]